MIQDKKLNDIMKDIKSYIERKVNVAMELDKNKDYKKLFELCLNILDGYIIQVQEVIDEYDKLNFTMNRIEQEGYLRGLMTVKNELKSYYEYEGER